MPFLPLRAVFRSRWTSLLWAGGICLSAVQFASGDAPSIDAANASETPAANIAALAAELE